MARAFLATLVVGFLFYVLLEQCGVRWNLTESAPVGMYGQARWGDYLGFCPEGAASRLSIERGYRTRMLWACPDGRSELIKHVAAKPGDTVTVSTDGIAVNGHLLPHSAPRTTDRAGRPLMAYPAGTYQASDRQIWVVSDNPLGFDSRYFGPVERGERLRFVWGW
jgi:conjugative transfer signal peptidase TraF